MRMRVVLFFGAMVFMAVAGSGQQGAAPAGKPTAQTDTQTVPAAAGQADSPVYTLHSTVREVSLDVAVTDASGHPVHGLTRDNFKILDEGQAQTLRGFDEHSGASAPPVPEFKLPPNTFTNYVPVGNRAASFVILFDSLDMPIKFQFKAYLQATAFLKELTPGTSVAIFDLNQRMNLLQGFTTDKTVLLNALKDKRAQPSYSALLDTGNEVWRQQTLNEGMTMMGRYLSGFPGRKNLIWFVRNIPGSLNSRTATISGSGNAPASGLTGADVAGDSVTGATLLTTTQPQESAAERDRSGTSTSTSQDGQSATGANQSGQAQAGSPANTQTNVSSQYPFRNLTNLIDDSQGTSDVLTLSRVVVYPVDPYELPTPLEVSMTDPDYLFEHAAMDSVAEATGGHAFYNRNGLKGIMQEIVAKGSDYYTLTYSPTDTKQDGAYRKLKVQALGGGAGGLHLAYRPGYYSADQVKAKLAGKSGLADKGRGGEDFRLASEAGTGAVAAGELPKESLQTSMTMGQIPPTELILNASVKPSASSLKLVKGEALPEGDFMREKFKRQPYREYDVLFATDVRGLQLPRSPDGLHRGGVEFIAVVYSDQGDVVNSFKVAISLNLREESYRSLLQNGMGTKRSIAIPIKGNYVVRLGVHDLNSDRVGALEFPMTSVSVGQVRTP